MPYRNSRIPVAIHRIGGKTFAAQKSGRIGPVNQMRPVARRVIKRMRAVTLGPGSDGSEFFTNVFMAPTDFPAYSSLEASYDVARCVRARVTAYAVADSNGEVDTGALIGAYDPDSTGLTTFEGVIRKSNARVHPVKSIRRNALLMADFIPKFGMSSGQVQDVAVASLPFDTSRPPNMQGYSLALKLPVPATDPSVRRTVLVEEQLEIELSVPK